MAVGATEAADRQDKHVCCQRHLVCLLIAPVNTAETSVLQCVILNTCLYANMLFGVFSHLSKAT